MALGTPLGLAFASGINAYLPLLSFAISARFFHLYTVNPNVAFITQDWFLIALVLLTLADFVADKFPIIDHSWDAVHTVIRPLMGALVATASSGQFHLPGTSLSIASSHYILGAVVATTNSIPVVGLGLLVILLLGGVLAAMSHTAKATTRLVSTLTTAGFFNVVLSVAEDVLVCIVILLSLLVPLMMLILLGLFLLVFGPRLFRAWSRRLGRRRFL